MTIASIFGIITAIFVVTNTNTVYSVLWLVATFIIASIILSFINLGFPALLYIIVYVGAIAILFLFVVQLLDLNSTVQKDIIKTDALSPLAAIITLALSVIGISLGLAFKSADSLLYLSNGINQVYSFNTDFYALNISGTLYNLAEWLYGPAIFNLLIVSLILLISMVAPIYLCL